MKKLNVPYYQQLQPMDCVVACLKMVTEYFQNKQDDESILSQVNLYPEGIYLPQAATYLSSLGFKTEIIGLNPYFFNAKDIGKSPAETNEKIKNAELKKQEFEVPHRHFMEYIDQGGKVTPCIITKQIIIDEINAENPVMAQYVSRVLHGHKEGYNCHNTVILGYDENNFIIHDPGPPQFGGGTHFINQDLVINAINMLAHDQIDNAYLLKVSR